MTIELLEDTIEATQDLSETNVEDSDMSPTSGCSLDCVPETTDVTIDQTVISGAGLTIAIADLSPADATKKHVTLTVDTEDNFDIQCRFIDNSALPGEASPNPPDTDPGTAEFRVTTNDEGVVEFDVEHQGAQDTWYLVCELFGALEISSAFTLG